MAKRCFFSFHYQDVIDFRANVVRQHWVTKPDRQAAGFFDASIWQSATRMGDPSVKRLINGALEGTSVTCVMIGSQTHARKWVRYEILKSFRKGSSSRRWAESCPRRVYKICLWWMDWRILRLSLPMDSSLGGSLKLL